MMLLSKSLTNLYGMIQKKLSISEEEDHFYWFISGLSCFQSSGLSHCSVRSWIDIESEQKH